MSNLPTANNLTKINQINSGCRM